MISLFKQIGIIIWLSFLFSMSFSQERPDLLFREDWKEIPAEIPVHQKHVMNDDLIVHLYGPGADSLKKSHHAQPLDDPYYIWSGLCLENWAVALEHRTLNAKLTDMSKIRWRSKQFGFRQLHIILQLANGDWIVSEQSDGPSSDWRIAEFNLGDLTWRQLDIENIIEGRVLENPDLSNINQIGFTDLMRGGKSLACSRLDWLEVYAFPVKK
jgi:hypothetical protein